MTTFDMPLENYGQLATIGLLLFLESTTWKLTPLPSDHISCVMASVIHQWRQIVGDLIGASLLSMVQGKTFVRS